MASATIINDQNFLELSETALKRRLEKILRSLGLGRARLEVLLTDDEEIRRLNRDFRRVDRSTNVLAFPNTDLAAGLADHLGELALSTETVRREAAERQIEPDELFHFYLVHGLLHLLGHDHELGPQAEEAQNEETERLLSLMPRRLRPFRAKASL
ncbi:MAG: rRNA maturation RNase YbeY [Deltaproteobacteria bacterium]|nr:rRNA maturation RNase YbeY [Deltaproteobacteria bacterium]